MGAHVDEPAPTISMPVFSMTTFEVLSAGEYCVTCEWLSPVKIQKSPPLQARPSLLVDPLPLGNSVQLLL